MTGSPDSSNPRRLSRLNFWRKPPAGPGARATHHTAASLDEKPAQPFQGTDDPGGPSLPSPVRRDSPGVNSMVNNLSLGDVSKSLQPSVSHKRVAEEPPQEIRPSKYSSPVSNVALQSSSARDLSSTHQDRAPATSHQLNLDALVRGKHAAHHDHDTPSSPVDDDDGDVPEGDTTMLLQPETRPITQEQLINEVKGIYAGLVMVEKKCVEITTQRASSDSKLSNDQWQALIALHRTLLHEHHDFFLASQHPTASPALRRLANKYAMPARMWRHAIHSFLELLRQQLPDSLEHMLAFVYIAYSMMALLMESVPSFLETWIECLGDLARYRMAIEEADMRDREVWSNVARTWYNKAADKSPNIGRIQHHLAVLSRPNIVQQLFYYSKALVSVVPFANARDSIMLLFTPLLDKEDTSYYDRYPAVEASFVSAFGILFTRGPVPEYLSLIQIFLGGLDEQIARMGAKWKTQGPEVAASLIAGVMDFGNDQNPVWTMYQEHMAIVKSRRTSPEPTDPVQLEAEDTEIRTVLHREFWANVETKAPAMPRAPKLLAPLSEFNSSEDITVNVLQAFRSAIVTNANKIGDRNIVPFVSFILSFIWSLSYVGRSLIYLEAHIPWSSLVLFLNTLGRSGVSVESIQGEKFPKGAGAGGRQLPEDFPARGAVWAQHIFPPDFFRHNVTDEDERTLEFMSHTAPRCERCLWLGVRLASLNRYIHYNASATDPFSVSKYALSLEQGGPGDMTESASNTLHKLAGKPREPTPEHREVEMEDVQTVGARTAETENDYVVVDKNSSNGASRDNDRTMKGT